MLQKIKNQEYKDKQKAYTRYNIEFLCEFCGGFKGLKLESSRTVYYCYGEFDSSEDPNRDKLLCRKCATMHHDFWDDMWAAYPNCR